MSERFHRWAESRSASPEPSRPRHMPAAAIASDPEQLANPAARVSVLYASEAEDVRHWNELVTNAPLPDVYFRPGYTSAFEVAGHGRAVGLVAEAGDGSLLVPLLLRDLDDLPAAWGVRGLDAVTAYGYGGLLPLHDARPSVEQTEAALRGVHRWCVDRGIVSVLFRLHPLLDQRSWLSAAIGRLQGFELRPSRSTCAIAVEEWSERDMRKGRRSDLKVAQRSLRVTWSSAGGNGGAPPLSHALQIFGDIYAATMERLQASSFYLFTRAHYDALARGLGDRLGVAIAWHGDQAVAAALFLSDQVFAHYHLSGSTQIGREYKAATLLVRAAVDWARARGCRFVHLGGGTSGDDTLFEFKRAFGGTVFEYDVMTLVAVPARYASLVRARQAAGGALRPDFFPAYRA